MALIVPEQSQRPYRFGMTLLCIGALFNWLGLADSYTEPVPAVRYIGVGLIAVGAALICLAMCFWMRAVQDPQYAREYHNRQGINVINIEEPDPRSLEKPPDYATVVDIPPSYEDAIKLDPSKFIYASTKTNNNNNNNEHSPIKIEEIILTHSNNNTHNEFNQNRIESTEDISKDSKEDTVLTIQENVIDEKQIEDNNTTNSSSNNLVNNATNSNITKSISNNETNITKPISNTNSIVSNVFRKSFRILRKQNSSSNNDVTSLRRSMSFEVPSSISNSSNNETNESTNR